MTCACGCPGEPRPGKRYVHGHNGRRPLAERFAEKTTPAVDLSPNGMADCLLWTGGRISTGYGEMARELGETLAHRLAWLLDGRVFPAGLPHLDHLCRRPLCVNVDHLEPVTHAENLRRGAGAKLTAEQASDIKYLREAGWNAGAIAGVYGVSERHVYNIAKGQNWAAV